MNDFMNDTARNEEKPRQHVESRTIYNPHIYVFTGLTYINMSQRGEYVSHVRHQATSSPAGAVSSLLASWAASTPPAPSSLC